MTPRDASYTAQQAGGAPAFLTIEEAAAVLRIGRTAAYQLARRWEETSGAAGLPVVRFGRLLRVPMRELERLAAGAIYLPGEEAALAEPEDPEARTSKRTAHRGRTRVDESQASLFPTA